MSFLLRPASRLPSTISRTQLPASTRFLATTPIARKTAVDSAQETLEQAKQKAGELGAEGAEQGSECTPSCSVLPLLVAQECHADVTC